MITTTDEIIYDSDARYYYYLHGPLARAEFGQHNIQGLDYAYTIQGWLKGMNSNSLMTNDDIGLDGHSTSTNRNFAKDAFGYTIGYFNGDYSSIGATSFNALTVPANANSFSNSLYNGNISHIFAAKFNPQTAVVDNMLQSFKYDQLHRLKNADTRLGWNGSTWAHEDGYGSSYKYDANGNIKNLIRGGDPNVELEMDDLTYHYDAGGTNNRLLYVTDAVDSENYPSDIDSQSPGNYAYDEIGNLTQDLSEDIISIKWNVSGKVKSVHKDTTTGDPLKEIRFGYDAMGNRVMKEVLYTDGYNPYHSTFYIRDAQGNVMATYEKKWNPSAMRHELHLTERYIYGSSRLGVQDNKILLNYPPIMQIPPVGIDKISANTAGSKKYELTNHLGNVLAVVSDIKIPVDNNGEVAYYLPDVVSAQDYYPGGSIMPGRAISSESYRYGHNGQETDPEITNSWGSHYTAEYWMYDSRLGRRWNVDPVVKTYQSQYCTFANNPIINIDPNGDDEWDVNEAGEVNWVRPSETHTLFSTDKSGKRSGQTLTLKDRSLFDQLSNKTNGVSVAKGDEDSQDDMAKTFLFLADNTKVEWRMDRYKNNDNNDAFALGSNHSIDNPTSPSSEQMGHSSKSVISFVHSHPNTQNIRSEEISSMGWMPNADGTVTLMGDAALKRISSLSQANYYTYFPNSGNLWVVRDSKEPAYIRNLNSNYKRLFFGTLNTK